MRATRSGLGRMRGDEIGMPPTTAGGAVTRQLSVPFTPGIWLAEPPFRFGGTGMTPSRRQIVICDGRKGNGKATAAANPANG
jgi:hypothetical protein